MAPWGYGCQMSASAYQSHHLVSGIQPHLIIPGTKLNAPGLTSPHATCACSVRLCRQQAPF